MAKLLLKVHSLDRREMVPKVGPSINKLKEMSLLKKWGIRQSVSGKLKLSASDVIGKDTTQRIVQVVTLAAEVLPDSLQKTISNFMCRLMRV